MRRSYSRVYTHFVWATYNRLPLLTPTLEPGVYAAILAKCAELKCRVLALGGTEDHLHLLVRLHPCIGQADFMRQVKGASSHLATHTLAPNQFFRWQGAYGAFSVEEDRLAVRVRYIRRQKEHHRDNTQDPQMETIFEEDDKTEDKAAA